MGDPLPHLCHTAVPPWGSFLVALEFLLSVWVENENEPTEPAQLILSALCLWEKRVLGSVGPGPVQPRGFRRSRRREPGQASDRPSPAPRSVLRTSPSASGLGSRQGEAQHVPARKPERPGGPRSARWPF